MYKLDLRILNSEIDNLKDTLFLLSVIKEQKQQKYLQNQQEYHNQLTGETYTMSYSLKLKQMQKVKERQQQIYAIVNLANQKKLKPLFLTLTVPSEYHPFIFNQKTRKIIKKNPKFKFNTIDEAISPAYQILKETYKAFYYQVKKIDKSILYIKVYEPHKTLIPHLHVLLFINEELLERVKTIFYKQINNHQLKRVDIDESLVVDDVEKPQAYIMKYLFKTTLADNDYMARWLDGWRRKYKIRILESSQLPMSLEVYRNLYYSLPDDLKEQVDKEIQVNETNYFEYFMNNTDIDIQIINENENLISHKRIERGKKIKIL
jgi:hypothetical protein